MVIIMVTFSNPAMGKGLWVCIYIYMFIFIIGFIAAGFVYLSEVPGGCFRVFRDRQELVEGLRRWSWGGPSRAKVWGRG